MCATLGIRIIPASSPQAKGRVERSHGTHQDRLIKKLRRAGIADYDRANSYLTATYWAAHNARFTHPPASPEDFHTPVPQGVDLAQVFRLEAHRTVSNDWVVQHDTRLLQIDRRQRIHPPARSTVLVCEYEDGHLEVWYRDQRVRWTDITGSQPTRPSGRPPADRPALSRRTKTPGVVVLRRRQTGHPWQQGWQRMPGGFPEAAPKHPRGGNAAGVDEARTLAHTGLQIVPTGPMTPVPSSAPHDSHISTAPPTP